MADYTAADLESWSYYQYPKLFMSSRSNAYLKNEFGDLIRDQNGQKIITHKIRETSSYAEMSDKAKALYMILFDRLCLSFKTNRLLLDSGVKKERLDFLDENGSTYIVFTNKEIMDRMDIRSENTVTKAKKELVNHGLLREKRMGMNKANRLYPQKIDGTKKITEWRDLETDEITDKFDHKGVCFYHVEKVVENAPLKGTVKNEAPKNTVPEPQKVQSIKPDYKSHENNDTNQYGSEDYFLAGVNHLFLTKTSVKELSKWGFDDAQKLQDIIFRTKRKVEETHKVVLDIAQEERISGELWAEDLQFEIIKFNTAYRKLDTNTRQKKVDNPMGFFTKMMQNFWLAALTIQVQRSSYDEIPNARAFFRIHDKTLLQGYFEKFDQQILEKALSEFVNPSEKKVGLSILDRYNWQDGTYVWE